MEPKNDNSTAAQTLAHEPEQRAALAELQQMAAGEAPPVSSPEAIAAEEAASRPPIDLAAEFAGLLLTVTAVLKPALPSLAPIYTETSCQQAGAAVAAICNKHGWLQDGVIGGYSEELAALMVLGPMAVATYAGVKGDIAAARKAQPSIVGSVAAAPVEAPTADYLAAHAA